MITGLLVLDAERRERKGNAGRLRRSEKILRHRAQPDVQGQEAVLPLRAEIAGTQTGCVHLTARRQLIATCSIFMLLLG